MRQKVAFILLLFSLCLQAQRPWVENISRPYTVSRGLEGRHLSVWASHGRYYDQTKRSWQWQRPPLFCTCEDLFTQTIVVPWLIPMLENAGAVVFTPRERDWQPQEVIVDNDKMSAGTYRETGQAGAWCESPLPGFAFHSGAYQDEENPFLAGSARMTDATKGKNRWSEATYEPSFAKAGRYAVYVSYQSLPTSIDDAHYTVYHQGVRTDFIVNQQMGGGTWVYLGTFTFDKGRPSANKVVVSSKSQDEGTVTTDAVRFGGGMGNIKRGKTISGMPRCLEGTRYWAQWAGMPYQVYSPKQGQNDYADDINARSLMTNYLLGGSAFAPDSTGLHVPIELALAIHSDAGVSATGEGIYGSLTICTTQKGAPTLGNGQGRGQSKLLARQLLDNATRELRYLYGEWTRRDLYDRNYSETRLPVVPSTIFETLSHQNFGDMRLALDPNFRFHLARSIYKTLLRYLAPKGETPVVEPLTPKELKVEFTRHEGEVRLEWVPVADELEPSAFPTDYILYIALGNGAFDNGTRISGKACTVKLHPGQVYHFRVAAANRGGVSFPTATVSAVYQGERCPTVLVVDGFHRLSSPELRSQGFDLDKDPGVWPLTTTQWIGRQRVFDLSRLGGADSTGLGHSGEELAGQFVMGNAYNNVKTHATAIASAKKYNVVSCSSETLEHINLSSYAVVDLLLGLERSDGRSLVGYKSITTPMRHALAGYAATGGRLLVSGAFIGSDMQDDDEALFLSKVLGVKGVGAYRGEGDNVKGLGTQFSFYHRLNATHYAAVATDRLMPAHKGAFSAMTYADGTGACVAQKAGKSRCLTMGFPFECIKDTQQRASLMKGILNFLMSNE